MRYTTSTTRIAHSDSRLNPHSDLPPAHVAIFAAQALSTLGLHSSSTTTYLELYHISRSIPRPLRYSIEAPKHEKAYKYPFHTDRHILRSVDVPPRRWQRARHFDTKCVSTTYRRYGARTIQHIVFPYVYIYTFIAPLPHSNCASSGSMSYMALQCRRLHNQHKQDKEHKPWRQ